MIRVRHIGGTIWLALAAGMLLESASVMLAAQQKAKFSRPSPLSSSARPVKPTWHSGPATTPPETEVVHPHRGAPPQANSTVLEAKFDGKKPGVIKSTGSDTATAAAKQGSRRLSASAHKSAPTTIASQEVSSSVTESPSQRAQDDLSRLRNDPAARRAFYDELQHTVEQVRSGQTLEKSQRRVFTLTKPKSRQMGDGNETENGKFSPYNL